ncbi:helix-turn-helix transcriptional regulator [Nocardioides speluncae]|uniref:helix-turn-helix transcriptional regulator n=1 Tax=Nocardioides speluncae TaxID=2670337 RepID=UPI000D686216|nr:LuxR family transcriptional regulator [Nocardioides speluncae]
MTGTLERETELARIAAALDASATGTGQVLVIEGEAGIGKTRLVEETRRLAKERGFGRLQATGDELESAMAWGVVRQMVERSISRYSGATREAIVAGPTGNALSALDTAPAGPGAGDAEVARTLHALWWVAVDLSSTRPLLITVDDAQWSDPPSLGFLNYLSRRVADLPIALVVATRPPADRTGALAELTSSRHAELLLPRPLTRAAVEAFGADRGTPPHEAVIAAVHLASGGNPFLTSALLDELVATGHPLDDPASAIAVRGLGPTTVSRALLSRLTPDALALAGAAAVLGHGHGYDALLAGELVELPPDRLQEALDRLVADNVLIRQRTLAFVHPVIREATLAALGPVETAHLHARAATTLHAGRAPAAVVAAHLAFAPAGSLAEAADLLREAAVLATAAGDHATAARHLERATAEQPDDQTLAAELGRAQLRAGDVRRARPILRSAAVEHDDPLERARLHGQAASATAVLDGGAAAVAELTDLLAGMPATLDPPRLVLEARLGVIRSFLPEERRTAAARLRDFAHLPGTSPDERTLLALSAQRGRYEADPHDEVARLAARALSEGALFDDASGSIEGMVGWVVAVMSLVAADGVAMAGAEIRRARERVQRHGSPVEFAMVANTAQYLAWRLGDVAGAEVESDSALAAVEPEDNSSHVVALRATAAHFGAHAALERGEVALARRYLDDFDRRCGQASAVIPAMWLLEAKGRTALAEQDPTAARAAAQQLRKATEQAGLDPASVPWRWSAALAALRLGDEDEARTLAEEQVELAHRWGAPTDVGAALRLRGMVSTGEPASQVKAFEQAVDWLEMSPSRLDLAKALVDLGECYRVTRRRTDARDVLVRGGELAADCGSRVLRDRAADALEAIGDRPRRTLAVGPDALTASERRVADLAVGGRTNRDIAQELFVSPKTVENHLGRIYTKLGIAGRRELVDALS